MNEVFYLFLLKRNDMVYLYSIHIVSQKASLCLRDYCYEKCVKQETQS